MDPIVWIILIIVLALIVLGLAMWLLGKKRKERHLHEAQQHRTAAREDLGEVTRRKQEAAAAQARAEEARLEAQRSEQAARESQLSAQEKEAHVEERIRTADKLDPRVDHKSKDYEPDPSRLHDDPAHHGTSSGPSHGTGTTESRTTATPAGGSHVDPADPTQQSTPAEYDQGYADGATEQHPDDPHRRI